MNRFIKASLLCCLLQSSFVFADTSKTFNYENQPEEVFNLENYLKEIKMIDQEVKDTCTKKVPYEENVCRDVTKYKKECKTIPAHEECRQVNDPICHTETQMETECHRLPSRQECRQVPNRVCGYETKYENVCGTTPDRQECRNVTEQQCRNETRYENECRTVPGEQQCRVVVRYRQECSTVPGGQQCTTVPGRVECSIVNGENRCTKIPPTQQCTNAPSRQECRQVPYEERECSQGPSRQECRQVPKTERVCENVNRQQCTTIPGRYECKQEPKQEYVCHDETKQECTTIPGDQVCQQVPREREVCEDNYQTKCEMVPAKEECKNIPYKEQVCKMETKYKEEKYECTKVIQVPQEKLLKTHKAAIKVEFSALSEILGPDFTVDLDTKGNVTIKAKSNDGEYYNRGTKAAVFVKKSLKAKEEGDVNNIEANYKVLMMDYNRELGYLTTSSLEGTLKKYSFSFRLNGKIDPKRVALALKITRKDIIEIDKVISKGNISYEYVANGNYTVVTVDLKAEGAKVGSILTGAKTEFMTNVSFTQNYSDAGEMILSKIQDFTWKQSKVFYLEK
nr:hypothetical protein BHI3_20200 [Bacteriovorax sp. HI3]